MDGGDSAGGSAGLAELIDEHGEELFADLIEYNGINLVQALKPGSGFSPRQLLILVRQLPPESRTVAAIRGGAQFRGWDSDRYLRAAMVDAIRENTYAFIAANSKRKPKPPEPIERPDKTSKRRQNKNAFAVMAANRISAAKKAKGG